MYLAKDDCMEFCSNQIHQIAILVNNLHLLKLWVFVFKQMEQPRV
jgi:hypothetical protein